MTALVAHAVDPVSAASIREPQHVLNKSEADLGFFTPGTLVLFAHTRGAVSTPKINNNQDYKYSSPSETLSTLDIISE